MVWNLRHNNVMTIKGLQIAYMRWQLPSGCGKISYFHVPQLQLSARLQDDREPTLQWPVWKRLDTIGSLLSKPRLPKTTRNRADMGIEE